MMYTFNSTSGAVQEVANAPWSHQPGYPFPSPREHGTVCLPAEICMSLPPGRTVQLYSGDISNRRTTPQLIPLVTQIQTLPFTCPPYGIGGSKRSRHRHLRSTSKRIQLHRHTTSLFTTLTFDPVSGSATIPTTGTTLLGNVPYATAMSPQGLYLIWFHPSTYILGIGNVHLM